MSETPTINWPGQSGKQYKYWIYPRASDLKESPGNYVYAKETSPGKWSPVYIGQTDNLKERQSAKYKKECLDRNGATHIHAHLSGDENSRLAEEADLIAKWQPDCNSQGIR
jgi:excinuclease UvrABC nuclease subunit